MPRSGWSRMNRSSARLQTSTARALVRSWAARRPRAVHSEFRAFYSAVRTRTRSRPASRARMAARFPGCSARRRTMESRAARARHTGMWQTWGRWTLVWVKRPPHTRPGVSGTGVAQPRPHALEGVVDAVVPGPDRLGDPDDGQLSVGEAGQGGHLVRGGRLGRVGLGSRAGSHALPSSVDRSSQRSSATPRASRTAAMGRPTFTGLVRPATAPHPLRGGPRDVRSPAQDEERDRSAQRRATRARSPASSADGCWSRS